MSKKKVEINVRGASYTILTDGENGFLIDNDVKSFENKLRELIADPQRVARAVPAAARTGADHRRRDHEDRAAARFVRRAVR